MAAEDFPPATVAAGRRRVGIRLQSASQVLSDLQTERLGASISNDVQFLNDKEMAAIEKVIKALGACQGNLTKVAKHLGV